MSVTTTADENLRVIGEHLKDAEKMLRGLPDDWGFDNYQSNYQDKIYSAMIDLKNLLKKLG